MKSIILAAGQGTRLRPVTNDIPKSMVKLFGESILSRQIKTLHSCNIDDISIVRGYKKNKIVFPNVTYFDNEKFSSTNMVESLFCAQSKISDSIIVSYGDIVYEKNVLEKLLESEDSISIVIDKNWSEYWAERFSDPLLDVESLTLKPDGTITSIGQKVSELDAIQGQYIGLMKFSKDGTEIIKDFYKHCKNESKKGKNILNPNLPFEKSYLTDFLQGLIDHGYSLKSVPIENGWLEIDTLGDLKLYENMYTSKKLSKFYEVT